MTKNQSKTIYAEDDYVLVGVAGADEPLPDPVPRRWLGTDLLEPGLVEFKGDGKPADKPVEIPDGDPSEDWTVKQLDLYAKDKSVDGYGEAKDKPAKLALVVDHYKTAAAS